MSCWGFCIAEGRAACPAHPAAHPPPTTLTDSLASTSTTHLLTLPPTTHPVGELCRPASPPLLLASPPTTHHNPLALPPTSHPNTWFLPPTAIAVFTHNNPSLHHPQLPTTHSLKHCVCMYVKGSPYSSQLEYLLTCVYPLFFFSSRSLFALVFITISSACQSTSECVCPRVVYRHTSPPATDPTEIRLTSPFPTITSLPTQINSLQIRNV